MQIYTINIYVSVAKHQFFQIFNSFDTAKIRLILELAEFFSLKLSEKQTFSSIFAYFSNHHKTTKGRCISAPALA
jgi:hypothetical protein